MIDCAATVVFRSPLRPGPVALTMGTGVHALLGRAADGGPDVLAALSGLSPVGAGRITLLGRPVDEGTTRRTIALVPARPVLPGPLAVEDALRLLAQVRAGAFAVRGRRPGAGDDAEARGMLELGGLAALARRPVRSLTAEQVKAVAILEALTAPGVRLALLDEPFVGVDPRLAVHLPGLLRAKVATGACVAFATASRRDAVAWAKRVWVVSRGAIVRSFAPGEGDDEGAARTRVRVVAADEGAARALLAALSEEPSLGELRLVGLVITVDGETLDAACAAIARSVERSGVVVVHVEECEAAPSRGVARSSYAASPRGPVMLTAAAARPANGDTSPGGRPA